MRKVIVVASLFFLFPSVDGYAWFGKTDKVVSEHQQSSDAQVSTNNEAVLAKDIFLTNNQEAKIGMPLENVLAVLRKKISLGYEITGSGEKDFKEINISNLYQVEVLENYDQRYEVLYFLSAVKNPDGIISNEELIPFIFEDNPLIAKGYDFLFKLKKELDI